MNRLRLRWFGLLCSAAVALSAGSAFATTVQDIVRLKGHERNVLTGMGLVIGLPGTGDTSKDSYIAARPFAQFLRNLDNPVASMEELQRADSYAIVAVTMEIPPAGVREGDRLDVHVETLFNAESLEGGRLIVSPLYLPAPVDVRGPAMAQANGQVFIEGINPRSGVVRGGGQMLTDILTNPVSPLGTLTLVLKDQYAGYPNATAVSGVINDEFAIDGYAEVARAIDAKNVRVTVPQADRSSPAGFIASVMTIAIDPSLIQSEARIVVNEKQGIILVTGDVEIGPVGITHRGLSITSITPEPPPTEPVVTTTRWAPLDTTDRQSRASTKLLDLLRALDQLNVPVQDQIAIVYELKKTGALHAEIVNR